METDPASDPLISISFLYIRRPWPMLALIIQVLMAIPGRLNSYTLHGDKVWFSLGTGNASTVAKSVRSDGNSEPGGTRLCRREVSEAGDSRVGRDRSPDLRFGGWRYPALR